MEMKAKGKILWADDEIDLLKAHLIFLEEKGYNVQTVTNGEDAVACVQEEDFDIIFLDEMMPGMDGLETLVKLKEIKPNIPVVMITKNEEESLMEEAIGSKIDDYLTKPVNPSQILLSCKKCLEKRKIKGEKISREYAERFNKVYALINSPLDYNDWIKLHLDLCEWEIEMDGLPDLNMSGSLADIRKECNSLFSKYIENRYKTWMYDKERPELSLDIIPNHIIPELKAGKKVVFIVLDCIRLDQWLVIEPYLYEYFNISRDYYYSILPTATPYSRNSIFSGLFPSEIEKQHPDIWQEWDDEDDSRNRYERELLDFLLEKNGINLSPESKYIKVLNIDEAKTLEKNIASYSELQLIAIVINFADLLAHKRSESEVLREITQNESAYRSVTRSWFEHSPLFHTLRTIANNDHVVFITSDHGSIRGQRGTKVIGDKETSKNLRYKYGRNLQVDPKNALVIKTPYEYRLPERKINCQYILAREDYLFLYPTNYNYYHNLYKDSFQHGGVSLEEMILPLVKLTGK